MSQTTLEIDLPDSQLKSPISFSIIVETENLASADLEGLFRSIDALDRQTLSPRQANEVLMVETGDVPETVLSAIRDRYQWVNIVRIDAGLEYYQAKMRGIAMTTGEAVVLCDSDCIYNPEWLASMLAPFHRSDVQLVAGETSLKVDGVYGLAMALTYIFPRYTRGETLQPTGGYFCNNVAFRRQLLADYPIPGKMPLYRGNCVIHAHQLAAGGHQIWQQPNSRAFHAPPNGFSHFVSRFFMLGYDALCISRFAKDPIACDPKAKVQADQPTPLRPVRDLAVAGMLLANKLKTCVVRSGQIVREDWRYGLMLPLALPIAGAAIALYTVGLAVAYLRPAYWLKNKSSLEALLEHS